jgi:hypothetical protein
MKQTAVEWLIDNWIKFNDIDIELDDFANLRPLLKQAKRMEEEQSLNFAKHCLDKAKDLDVRTAFFNVEQYFNETFNTKEK